MSQLPVDRFTIEKAFYGALKLHVYGSIHDSFLNTLLGGRSLFLNDQMRLEVARFTARKTNNLFVPENGNRSQCSAEFFGFTSHKVREKLLAFHEAGIVELLGKGLRDAYTYRWKLPVKHWEVCSFMKFRAVTADDASMSLETYRIYLDCGLQSFTFHEFLSMYVLAHEAEYGATRWGKRKFEKIASSYQYEQFLKSRLEKLAQHQLILKTEKDVYQLNPQYREQYTHLDLFMNAVPFHPSRDMCAVCPLDDLCQAGSTQKLILTLNQTVESPREDAR